MNKQETTKYLENVVELEKICYEENSILNNLQKEINRLYNSSYQRYKEYPSKPYMSSSGEKIMAMFIVPLIVSVIAFFILWLISCIVLFFLEDETKGVICIILSAIIFVIAIVVAKADNDEEYEKMEKYKKDCATIQKENDAIKLNNEHLKRQCLATIQRLQNESDSIKNNLNTVKKTLSNYYSMNVIYPKYRNFSCTSSILEYYLSGRCESLTGHEGAYNILENEIRFGLVFTKLDIVIKSLEKIKQNQSLLYEAIEDCNRNISNVSSNLISSANKMSGQIADMNNQISNQLDSINYTNSISARNTQIIKDIEVYNFLKS